MKLAAALLLSAAMAGVANALPHDGSDVGYFNPECAFFKRGDRIGKAVALTFDDGPHPTSAPVILDILKKAKIHATFFVVGEKVNQYPALVRQMFLDGDEVGNHTMTHPRLDTLSPEEIRHELWGCEEAVERATGRGMSLMRPPGMHFTPEVLKIAKGMGYDTIGWNVGAKDFTLTKSDPKLPLSVTKQLNALPTEVAERVVENVKNGAIILLHDSPSTAAALPEIIKSLRKEGYRFETVTQMMRALPDPVAVVANPKPGRRADR